MLRLKAIASSLGRREKLAMTLSRDAQRGADEPVRDAVPSSARLDCYAHRRAALYGAYLLEDRAATRSFSPLEPEAGHGSAVEPSESATRALVGSAVSALRRSLVAVQRAGIGGRSPAGDCIGNEEVAT
jgi:hypothetical protein